MKNSKKSISFFLSLVMMLSVIFYSVPMGTVADARGYTASEQQKIDENNRKIAENNANKAKVKGPADQLQNKVDNLQSEISDYDSKINELNGEIDQAQAIIDDSEAKMSVEKEKIDKTQKLLGERLNAMYRAGNVSKLEILLEADSFESLLTRMELVSRITRHDNEIVDELKNHISKFEKAKSESEKKKKELSKNKKEVEEAKSKVAEKKSEYDVELNKLKTYIDGLDASSKELQAVNDRIERERIAASQQTSGSLSKGSGSSSSGLVWPVPASHSITCPFGNGHRGLDVGGGFGGGQAVVAAASGVVVAAGQIEHWSFGNMVVIDHGNGLATAYAHLGSISVSPGQQVSQGQTIGTVGYSGRCIPAGPGGAHLHFEVRVNGNVVNPANYV